jgi:hypothetical protein
MQRHPIEASTTFPQGKLFWAFIASLIVGQLAAVWMLCSYQVRTAQARHAGVQVVRTVTADCLRYVRNASRDSCDPTHGVELTSMSSATPVKVSFR